MFNHCRKRSADYQPVQVQENASDAREQHHMQSTQHRKAHTKLLAYALSFLSGILFTLVVLTLYHAIHPYSYETGFHTDIGVLRPIVDIVSVKFSGTLKYKGTHLYIDPGPTGVRYFGAPSPEVDKAWAKLTAGIGNEDPWPGGIVGPDVLHTLHCLNAARKLLDSPYYYNKTVESHNRGRRIHIDHCLDHVRQVIQCHMDITPVGTLYFPEMNTEVGDFDQVHMCRNFDKLHQFMMKEQKNEEPMVMDHEHGMSHGGGNELENGHREGYLENEESRLPWDTTWEEFE